MTPKVAKRGGSFKGAAAYYLHDKGADTNRRVEFCVTRNLPTEEPELAWRWMAYTAKHTGVLKDSAGGAHTGPKMRKPVYTLSLSWHADDKPTPDLMVAMMDSALKKIGLARCQSLYVAHNDTDHPHIHALVNLVDPENGKIIDPGRDWEKLSRWAQAYEVERGVVRCERRVENNARRDRGERVKDRVSKTRQDIEQAKLAERRILRASRKAGPDRPAPEWETMKQRAREVSQAIQMQMAEKYRPQWAALYRQARQDELSYLRGRQQARAQMRMVRQSPSVIGVNKRDWIASILLGMNKARRAAEKQRAAMERELNRLKRRMEAERADLTARMWAAQRETIPPLRDLHAEALRNRERGAPSHKSSERGGRPGPRDARHYDALKSATPEAQMPDAQARRREELKEEFRRRVEEREAAQRTATRPGRRRSGDYEALKSVTPESPETGAPPRSEEERRRRELKAEFRRQAEELTRRRRERPPKDKDRDRDRER